MDVKEDDQLRSLHVSINYVNHNFSNINKEGKKAHPVPNFDHQAVDLCNVLTKTDGNLINSVKLNELEKIHIVCN